MEDPRLQHSDTEVHQCGHLAKVNPYQLLNGCRAIWIRTLRNRQGYSDFIDSQYHMFQLLLFLLQLNVILDGV
jgi:hypothetical protein